MLTPPLSRLTPSPTVTKDPWLSVNLSMFFPGIGQIYAGKHLKGLFWILLQIFTIIFTVWQIFSPIGSTRSGLIGLTGVILIYLVNILDAHLSVYLSSADRSMERIPRKNKNPWFAVFASRVIPGLGQLYAQQVIVGISLLFIYLLIVRLDDFFSSLMVLPPLLAAFSIYHVYHTFPRQNHPHRHTYRGILALMVGVIFSVGIAFGYLPDWLDARVAQFEIPSESMIPTLQVDDRVLVSKSPAYIPARGDIVVFNTPDSARKIDPTAGDYFIKRIIGLPGERVAVMDGRVYINDRPLQPDFTTEPADYTLTPVTVPDGSFFVMGDNRDHSFDSHAWGFLNGNYIIGPAYKILWPLDRVQPL